ncbi:Uu.00g034680.m01.CDS01 [Anthostomella pinea]|uniref:Uu.00g034680.m01.CDS01 n=1 Tax=Anthostomella pinea TaxID=933095 RepID=A0AAI8V936_9PEZI|nr:Uu.00g034680.m01.CDS01 [Anthostomella pinea]
MSPYSATSWPTVLIHEDAGYVHGAVFSSSQGSLEKAKLLVEVGKADVNELPYPDIVDPQVANTPLHEAAKCGAIKVAEYLLQKGADVRTKDSSGKIPKEGGCRGGLVGPRREQYLEYWTEYI